MTITGIITDRGKVEICSNNSQRMWFIVEEQFSGFPQQAKFYAWGDFIKLVMNHTGSECTCYFKMRVVKADNDMYYQNLCLYKMKIGKKVYKGNQGGNA